MKRYSSCGQYCSFDLCCLCSGTACPKKGVVPRIFIFMICILSQIVISVCLSSSVMYKSGPVEGLSVEIMARSGHCQIFPSKFNRLYINNEINNFFL